MWARSSAVTPASDGEHQGTAPWYDPRATSSLRRPVPARAMVTQAVVASVPFLENCTQSACATVATIASASSTITAPGPFWQSPSAAWAWATASTSEWRWPRITGPQLHMKST